MSGGYVDSELSLRNEGTIRIDAHGTRTTAGGNTMQIHAHGPPARRQPPVQPTYTAAPLPNRYPAYDAQARRIGLEHIRPDAVPHQPGDGTAYYRPQTLAYPVQNTGPRVMNFTLYVTGDKAQVQANHDTPTIVPPSGTGDTRESHNEHSPAPRSASHTPLPTNSTPTPTPPPSTPSNPGESPPDADISQLGLQEDADPTPRLRELLGLGPDEEVNLWSLGDSPHGAKPNYPYPTLIKLAIQGSPQKRLTLQGIYAALEQRFEWYREHSTDKAWQVSTTFFELMSDTKINI